MANKEVTSFWEAAGPIDYNMTNDYMFRYILQKNKKVLKGLICALLHLKPEEIKSIEILNPIDLAGEVSGKDFILDIKVILNNEKIINLEMQVKNEYNWPERSLSYLCRSYDQLYSGQDYEEALPAIHIGFVDFALNPKESEFYATYKLLNVKNHHVYSDKFILSVVNLGCIELATEEDKAFRIDYWARIFKAKTWEELKMLAKDDEYLQEAATAMYVANADYIVRQKCIARMDAERLERTLKRNYRLAKEECEAAKAERDVAVSERDVAVSERDVAVSERDVAVSERNVAVSERNVAVSERDVAVSERDVAIAERDAAVAKLAELKARIKELQEKNKN